jgi:antirestriction protein ArdC
MRRQGEPDSLIFSLKRTQKMPLFKCSNAAFPNQRQVDDDNSKAYRGVNVLMLWAAAMEKGYTSPLWMTYKQAVELKGQVRKGEKGSLVVYADTFTKTGTDEKGAAASGCLRKAWRR